jgi:hypothetical protein
VRIVIVREDYEQQRGGPQMRKPSPELMPFLDSLAELLGEQVLREIAGCTLRGLDALPRFLHVG